MNTFGEFVEQKRKEKQISIRQLADMIGISPSYVSAVEKGRRNPYDKSKLDKLIKIFCLTKKETDEMYELAGKSKIVKANDTVSADISSYIRENDYVGVALRTARDLQAGEEEWLQFVNELIQRKKGMNE